MKTLRWIAFPVAVLTSSGCGPREATGVQLVVSDFAGAPVPAAIVVVHDDAGVPLTQSLTGSDGRAELDVPLDGMVSVFAEGAPEITAHTFLGVRDGDRLHVRWFSAPSDEPPPTLELAGTAHFRLPGPYGSASVWVGLAQCPYSIGSGPVDDVIAVEIYDQPCLDLDVTPYAMAATAGDLVAFALGSQVGSADLFSEEVVLPGWRTDFDLFDIHVASADAQLTWAGVTRVDASGRTLPAAWDYVMDPLFDTSLSLELLPLPYARTWIQAGFTTADGWALLDSDLTGPASSVDLARTDFLPIPALLALAVESSAASVTWATPEEPALADSTEIQLLYWLSGNQRVRWQLVAPPDVVSPFATPQLPETLAAWRPTRARPGESGYSFHYQVGWTGRDDLDGYAGARSFDPLLASEPTTERHSAGGGSLPAAP